MMDLLKMFHSWILQYYFLHLRRNRMRMFLNVILHHVVHLQQLHITWRHSLNWYKTHILLQFMTKEVKLRIIHRLVNVDELLLRFYALFVHITIAYLVNHLTQLIRKLLPLSMHTILYDVIRIDVAL